MTIPPVAQVDDDSNKEAHTRDPDTNIGHNAKWQRIRVTLETNMTISPWEKNKHERK